MVRRRRDTCRQVIAWIARGDLHSSPTHPPSHWLWAQAVMSTKVLTDRHLRNHFCYCAAFLPQMQLQKTQAMLRKIRKWSRTVETFVHTNPAPFRWSLLICGEAVLQKLCCKHAFRKAFWSLASFFKACTVWPVAKYAGSQWLMETMTHQMFCVCNQLMACNK